MRGLDDMSTSHPQQTEGVMFSRGDVSDRPKLWTLLQGVDVVYHLAARVFVSESKLYPREYNAVNVGGTVSLMEAMRDVGVRRVVFISSGAVYGTHSHVQLSETLSPDPASPYAVSKLAAEHYVRTIGTQWGIETVCLRVFNAYGPGQQLPPSHPPVIPNLLRQAVHGGTMVMHGSGEQTRDFVYVDDVVQAMIAAATALNINRSIINVGSGEEISVRELVNTISHITGTNANVITNTKTDTGVSRMCADLTLAREKLHYQPRVSLETGLRRTLAQDTRFQTKPTK